MLDTIRKKFYLKLNNIIRKVKSPRMVWGYEDSSGNYRKKTRLSDTTHIYHPNRVSIADNVFVWHYTILDGTGGLKIGEGTQIGAWVGIFTHSSHIAIRIYGSHYQEVAESEKKNYLIKKTSIGKYVFIGAGSKILPGVTIGDGAVISAGSIVSKDINAFEIVSGNPANVIGNSKSIDKRSLRGNPQLKSWYEEWQKK